ncbi:hypothetical protein AURDEDRAFT_186004 [Auricularia subglabra TFB-10046 SS5]|nr:hypothetical protein AURDEDRAFT_186004 [Auricularia subglabra TFB-10046 SS5]
MTSATSETTVSLPEDILRHLIECAARSSHATAATLCRVSPTVRTWVLPILYGVVTFELGPHLKRFMESGLAKTALAVAATQAAILHIHPDLWRSYTLQAKHLRVPMTVVGLYFASQVRRPSPTATGRRLYLASEYIAHEASDDPLMILRLQQKSDFGAVCPPQMLAECFSGVTHFFAELDVLTASTLLDLVCMAPQLTHLGLSYDSDASNHGMIAFNIPYALTLAKRLERVYVRYLRGEDETDDASLVALRESMLTSGVRDKRIFIDVAPKAAKKNFWELDARGDIDIWALGFPLDP